MPPTPAPNTRRLVYEVVTVWKNLVIDLRAGGATGSLGSVLSRTVWLWEHRRPVPSPYDKYHLTPLLDELLATDAHLAMTCRHAQNLAWALHVVGLDQLRDSPLPSDSDTVLNRITDFLVDRLFEDEYVRRVYFRFYNLEIDESPLRLPSGNGLLERLEDWDVPAITGEATPTSTLHVPNTGNVFLLLEDSGSPEDDMEWWRAQWQDATAVLGVLKYLKYAVVDIDYSVIHFTPDWLNQVRRYGIAMWGRPRADVQSRRYRLVTGEEHTLARYLAAVVKFKPLLEDLTPTLRRTIATAGDYYEGHHKRTTPEDQLIDLVIALEALFSPKEKTELRFRISHRAALLLGSSPDDRKALGRFLRKVYDGRSDLVHQGKSPFLTQDVSSDELQHLGDLVREAILRLSVLYARGERDREQALKGLEDCAYDPASLEELRQKTDVETFLTEQEL